MSHTAWPFATRTLSLPRPQVSGAPPPPQREKLRTRRVAVVAHDQASVGLLPGSRPRATITSAPGNFGALIDWAIDNAAGAFAMPAPSALSCGERNALALAFSKVSTRAGVNGRPTPPASVQRCRRPWAPRTKCRRRRQSRCRRCSASRCARVPRRRLSRPSWRSRCDGP